MTDDRRGKTRTIWMYWYSIAWEGEVDVDVVLGGVEGDEDWGVVAFDHAVVEEEAESGSSYGGVVDFLGAYDLTYFNQEYSMPPRLWKAVKSDSKFGALKGF